VQHDRVSSELPVYHQHDIPGDTGVHAVQQGSQRGADVPGLAGGTKEGLFPGRDGGRRGGRWRDGGARSGDPGGRGRGVFASLPGRATVGEQDRVRCPRIAVPGPPRAKGCRSDAE
jgi:hypothetical protein